jgi:hypothetical protein
LSLCVQVTRAQEKNLGVPELLVANHHLLGQVLEQVSVLNSRVAALETHAARGFGGGGDRAGGSGRSQRKGTGKEKAGVASESELSDSERGGEDGVD